MTQEFISGYVYHKQLLPSEKLATLINDLSNSQSYYFLRYSHAVSGICRQLPSQRGEIEGQLFNSIYEIRWKKYKSGYEVLILSKQEFQLVGFDKLTGDWKISDRNAYWHNPEETRFPKGFHFQGENNQSLQPKNISIKQRYFQDSATATIHFVALTVNSNDQHTKT